MATTHIQLFWSVAADITAQPEDIGSEKRAQLHKAAWDLNSIASVIFAVAGGGTAQEHPEISLTFPAETFSNPAQFTDRIQAALAHHGLAVTPSLQAETRFYSLDEPAVKRVKAAVSFFREDEKEQMWRLIESAHSVSFASPESIRPPATIISSRQTQVMSTSLYTIASASAGGAPAPAPAPAAPAHPEPDGSFTITAQTYAALKAARGDDLRTATQDIYDAIESLKDETRSGAVALKMAAGGLVTVGIVMYEAYVSLAAGAVVAGAVVAGGSSLTFGAAALAAAGGPVGIAVAAAVIVAATVARYVVLRDAVNDLLVTNDSKFKITFNGDSIENGERAFKVDHIPARIDLADGAPAAYSCVPGGLPRPLRVAVRDTVLRGAGQRGRRLLRRDGLPEHCARRQELGLLRDVAAGGASARGGEEEDVAAAAHGNVMGLWGNVNYAVAFFESTA